MQRMKRFREDRGAVAVWVALMLVPLLVAAALAIDISAVNADRQRLQHGADAAALAIAQQCAMGECDDAPATAQELATANNPFGGDASGTVVELDEDAGRVVVETASDRDYWFAPVIGEDEVSLAARGAASWANYPSGGRSTIPFIFSTCQLDYLNVLEADASTGALALRADAEGVPVMLSQSKGVDSGCDAPYGNNFVPGGFGWISTSTADCSVETEIGQHVPSLSGNSQGSADHPCYASMRELIDTGRVGLLPVFETAVASEKAYVVAGYIAVTLERYRFQGNRCYAGSSVACSGPAASGNEGWIEIVPQRYIANDEDFDTSPDAPNLGAQVIRLQLP